MTQNKELEEWGDRISQVVYATTGKGAPFARSIDVHPGTFRTYMRGEVIPSHKVINAILEKYPEIDPVWLKTGVGDKGLTTINKVDVPGISSRGGVPYFDVNFLGGNADLMNDQTIHPQFYIDYEPFNDADFYINVTGHSMEPEIKHGDIAALELVKDRSFIINGRFTL